MGQCSFVSCSRYAPEKRLCSTHYAQKKRGVSLTPIKTFGLLEFCSFPDCGRRHAAKGFCKSHYSAWRAGRQLAPLKPRCKPGDTFIDSNGYVRIRVPGHPSNQGWPTEHRWVVEKFLGRRLLRNENVHHLNGNKLDNSLSNLELWVTSQPHGQRPLDLVSWAREIESMYGCLVDSGVL